MYLLEAKKKAEKEAKREEARKRQKDIRDMQKKQQKDAEKASKEAQKRRQQEEAKRREQEERQMQEAIRRSKQEEEERRRRQQAEEEQMKRAMVESSGKKGSRTVISSAPLRQERRFEVTDNADTTWRNVQMACKYVGTFPIGDGEIDRAAVKQGIRTMKQYMANARQAFVHVSLEGIKIIDDASSRVAMAHALARVSMCSVDTSNALFGFVAKNPGVREKFCHVFAMSNVRAAQELHALVGKAFKLSYVNRKKTDKASRRRSTAQWMKSNPISEAESRSSAPAPPKSPTKAPASLAAPKSSAPPKSPKSPTRKTPSSTSLSSSTNSIEDDLDQAAWYQAGLSREICMELLEVSGDGSFIVRDSQSQPGCFALTLKAGGQTHNYIIRLTKQGYILGSSSDGERPFKSLAELIVSHTENKGILPRTLVMDDQNHTYDEADDDDVAGESAYVDPEYQSVKDLLMQAKLHS